MKSIYLCGILSLLFFTSCSSINKSHMNSSVQISIASPMKAKVDVDMTRKLTGYASGGYLLHLLKISGDNKYADGIAFNGNEPSVFSMLSKVNAVKAAASYNAIRTSEADVLVNPQYVVEESNWNPFYKMIKVKVTGYPGKVVSIRNVQ
ncbi:hypothetical protein OAT67_04535 [Bacteriovoracaceae bacterium]|nr:hypothetical protein [Bacteriovoracaceae bacterium]